MSREEKYARLMRAYPGLTPRDIADMTPHQQLTLLNPPDQDDTVTFATEEEYARWTTRR